MFDKIEIVKLCVLNFNYVATSHNNGGIFC